MRSNNGGCYIIAELSANHGGSLDIVYKTMDAALEIGADAFKLQSYTADTITLDAKQEHFKINQGTHWDGQYLDELYQKAALPWEWHKPIFDYAAKIGIDCFSSPFDHTAVDFLEELNVPAYKIASFEITDIPLIAYVASKGKPVIISTGIANEEDIALAIETCHKAGNQDITLLKCTSEYPAQPENANLRTIPDMKERFGTKVGLSDHTLGIEAPIVAVSLGATVIEKHFILDKSIGGADAHFSLDKSEFKQMVDAVRVTEKLLGKVDYDLTEKKIKSRHFSRSLFIAEDVKKGEILTPKNVRSVRPGIGLHPKYYEQAIGSIANEDYKKGTPLAITMFE